MKKPTAPAIAMSPCKSSNIGSYGYDSATKTLAVQFHGGATWHYHGVTEAAYKALQNARSIGRHFGAHIRHAFKGSLVHAATKGKKRGAR